MYTGSHLEDAGDGVHVKKCIVRLPVAMLVNGDVACEPGRHHVSCGKGRKGRWDEEAWACYCRTTSNKQNSIEQRKYVPSTVTMMLFCSRPPYHVHAENLPSIPTNFQYIPVVGYIYFNPKYPLHTPRKILLIPPNTTHRKSHCNLLILEKASVFQNIRCSDRLTLSLLLLRKGDP